MSIIYLYLVMIDSWDFCASRGLIFFSHKFYLFLVFIYRSNMTVRDVFPLQYIRKWNILSKREVSKHLNEKFLK